MKLFSKSRISMIPFKGFRKYLVYAIGEIVLVVAGILIAVSINNCNEAKKQEQNLNNILQIFRSDIVQDTVKANRVMEIYNFQDSIGKIALSDTVSPNFLKKNGNLHGIIFSNYPLTTTTKGFDLLKNYSYDIEIAQDSVIIGAVAVYGELDTRFEDFNAKIYRDILDNMEYVKENYNFAADSYMGRQSEIADNFYTSDNFKNRLANTIHLKSQAVILLEHFNKIAKELIKEIDEKINENT